MMILIMTLYHNCSIVFSRGFYISLLNLRLVLAPVHWVCLLPPKSRVRRLAGLSALGSVDSTILSTLRRTVICSWHWKHMHSKANWTIQSRLQRQAERITTTRNAPRRLGNKIFNSQNELKSENIHIYIFMIGY